MNKIAKASIAGAAGVILLMGGAGSLAYWNNSAALGGTSTTISSGSLSTQLSGSGVWKQGTTTIDPATFKVVPGDTLTYTQSYTVTARGDNLLFTVGINGGALTASTTGAADVALKNALQQSASYTVTGANVSASTSANTYKVAANSGTSTITATVSITFPFGTTVDNATQSGNVALGQGAITLVQTQTP